MLRSSIIFGAALALPLALAGCGLDQLRKGEPNFDQSKLVSTLDPNDCPDDADPKPATVKNCVYALKGQIDKAYIDYRIVLHHTADYGNALADITNIGLTTAITATPGAAAKTVLGAIATGLSGAKEIVNQDLLYKQAIEIILNQMDADREQQFTIMLQEMNAKDSTYTMTQAKDDLLIYLAYGTWDHALQSLQNKAAVNQANCQSQLNNAKVTLAATGSASPQPATTPSGCNNAAPGQPPAPAAATSLTVPASMTTAGGSGSLTIPLIGFSSDVLRVWVSLPPSQISSVSLLGVSKGKTNQIDIKRTDLPASGQGGSLVFALSGIDPKSTTSFTVTQLGLTSAGLPQGTPATTTVKISGT